jgi:hypothetical protein
MLRLSTKLEQWEEVATLRSECPPMAHETKFARSIFDTSCCPSCWESIFLINDEIVLARVAADGDTEKVRRLVSQMGPDLLHEAFSIRRSYCMRRGMATERLYVCYWNMVPLYQNKAGINKRRCIFHWQVGTQRRQRSFLHRTDVPSVNKKG